ncbi:MAG: DUF2807 domain-containing protein [Bacteroidota bacterium]
MRNCILLLLVMCHLTLLAQRKPKIKGSRIVTEVNEELPGFNAVQLNDNLNIVLKKSFGPGYEIIADDNLIDVLKFEVKDSTLIVSSFYDITAKKQLDITINYTELKAITLKKGSVITNNIINSDELFVDAFADTKLDLKVSAGIMDINLEDNSRGDFNVDVDSLNISINNRAEAYMYAVNETSRVDLEGNASLTLEGTAERMEVNLTSNTKFRGEKMEAASIKANLDSSANARLYAYRDLELSAKGNSRIYLFGNPKITITEFMDTTQLIKKVE